MTVREVLGLPLLRGAQARVLAGESNLDRSVRWVHVAELPDISYLLKGGELLLTTGMGIQGVGRVRRRYVNELADAAVAGLVVEFAASGPAQASAILPGWAAHSRAGHSEHEPGRVHRENGPPRCTWAGIWLRHEPWGRVHVLEYDERPSEMISLLMDRASVALGLALLSQQDVAYLADRAGSALIADLLAGRYSSGDEILQRALSLGADLSGGRLAAVVVDLANLPALAEARGLAEAERQRIRLRVMELLRKAVAGHGCTGLTGIEGDRVLAVVAGPPARQSPAGGRVEVMTQVAGAFQQAAAAADRDLSVIVGVSRETAPKALRHAFGQAVEAAAYGRRLHSGGPAYHFGDLGTYRLLTRLAQGPELAAFVESELSPLLEHDACGRGRLLLPTLQAYLDNACRKADAARELCIQRRTLYGRLARIEQLLGRSLNEQDARTRLTLALQGLSLLRQRQRAWPHQ